STYVSPPPPAWGSTWRTERSRSCIVLQDAFEGALEREAVGVFAKPPGGRVPKLGASLVDAHDCGSQLGRLGRGGDRAVGSLLDELDGRIVRTLDDDDRHAVRRSFDDDQPIALAPRRKNEAERARQRLLEHRRVHEPRRHDLTAESTLYDRSQHRRPVG